MHFGPSEIALALAMTLVPLLIGAGTVFGAVMLYPKDPEQREREPGRKWISFTVGCLGLLLLLAGFGIGACWGMVAIG